MNEPIGVVALACPETPALLGFVSLMAPSIAMGNRVVIVPSERHPLSATDLYQVFDTSDLPGGVVNIVTGDKDALAIELAKHDAVDAIWYCGSPDGSAAVERASAGNLKQVWVDNGRARDWASAVDGEGSNFLRAVTQVKNIWIPYGE
jgi:aldehyde dehydrogenase (NAD+)